MPSTHYSLRLLSFFCSESEHWAWTKMAASWFSTPQDLFGDASTLQKGKYCSPNIKMLGQTSTSCSIKHVWQTFLHCGHSFNRSVSVKAPLNSWTAHNRLTVQYNSVWKEFKFLVSFELILWHIIYLKKICSEKC